MATIAMRLFLSGANSIATTDRFLQMSYTQPVSSNWDSVGRVNLEGDDTVPDLVINLLNEVTSGSDFH